LRLEVLARDGWRCQVRGVRCQVVASVVDHITPVRAGGAWWDKSNLRAACRSCNTARAYGGFEARRRPSREW
jgi:5-methylcytosine-specific restriction endonuclease McrA